MKLKEPMPELMGASEWLNYRTSREELLGKPTLFFFWAASCLQCQSLFPIMSVLENHYKHQVNLLFIHMPRSILDKDINVVKEKVEEYAINSPIYIDNKDIMSIAFNNVFTPAFYLFDKEGKLDYFQTGAQTQFLLNKIHRLIN